MQDPRQVLVPNALGGIERCAIFSRQLAYGFDVRDWGATYSVKEGGRGIAYWNLLDSQDETLFSDFIELRWNSATNPPPSVALLMELGFLRDIDGTGTMFVLTQKSFDLLKSPIMAPKVFISYKRGEGSLFALALEARLLYKGISCFVDKNLVGGGQWHSDLEKQIDQSDSLIALVSPLAPKSEVIQKEIKWALDRGKTVIPICFGGYSMGNLETDFPGLNRHGDSLKADPAGASAADYEVLINFVINALGYSTV